MSAEPPIDPATTMRAALHRSLLAARRAGDRVGADALRTAMAALDNAGAVPAPDQRVAEGTVAGAVLGIGATEVEPRTLSAQEVHAIVRAQVTEHEAEADRYDDLDRPDAAERLRRGAATLRRVLGEGR